MSMLQIKHPELQKNFQLINLYKLLFIIYNSIHKLLFMRPLPKSFQLFHNVIVLLDVGSHSSTLLYQSPCTSVSLHLSCSVLGGGGGRGCCNLSISDMTLCSYLMCENLYRCTRWFSMKVLHKKIKHERTFTHTKTNWHSQNVQNCYYYSIDYREIWRQLFNKLTMISYLKKQKYLLLLKEMLKHSLYLKNI